MTLLRGVNRVLGGAIALIALAIVCMSAASYVTAQRLHRSTDARGRSYQVLLQLHELRAAMLNQETGIRGFLITSRPENLQPYREAGPALDLALANLGELLKDDAAQTRQLREAEEAARAWQRTVSSLSETGTDSAILRAKALDLERTGEGKRRFDAFRDKVALLEAAEERALDTQANLVETAESQATFALLLGTTLTLAVCVLLGMAVDRLIAQPLTELADVMRRLIRREPDVHVPGTSQQTEVGDMARAVAYFQKGMQELDKTSVLRATADTLPALVGYIDANRRVGFVNGEFGRWFDLKVGDVSEIHGQPMGKVFADVRFPAGARDVEAAFAGQEISTEHRIRRPGSPPRDVAAIYRPHRSADGKTLGVVTLLTDITERKRLERNLVRFTADLKRSNEDLEQFAYVASHDLKAPLRGIDNLVTWIEEDLDKVLAGDTRTNMELLKSRVRRLETLLDDLLAYSRAGRRMEDTEAVEIGSLILELSALLSPPDGFVIEPAANLPTIEVNRAAITQVFQNLLGNAIKHSPDPATGRVAVEARSADSGVEFIVTDNGPGVPEQFRERVFGMFQTLKPRDEIEGSGMGLAIVRKIITNHGGRVWLEEGSGGRGLGVHFIWPLERKETSDDGTYG